MSHFVKGLWIYFARELFSYHLRAFLNLPEYTALQYYLIMLRFTLELLNSGYSPISISPKGF